MARLTYEELFAIARSRNVEVEDVTKYENLQTKLVFTCKKCGRKLEDKFENVRNEH